MVFYIPGGNNVEFVMPYNIKKRGVKMKKKNQNKLFH